MDSGPLLRSVQQVHPTQRRLPSPSLSSTSDCGNPEGFYGREPDQGTLERPKWLDAGPDSSGGAIFCLFQRGVEEQSFISRKREVSIFLLAQHRNLAEVDRIHFNSPFV